MLRRISDYPDLEDTMPLVSVSVTTYNHVGYIAQCIESILMQQTAFPVKIYVFDDCSTDGTTEIVRNYAKKFPSLFKLFIQPENTYRKPIRKDAFGHFIFERSKARYTALCEADDYWTDDQKLQTQFSFLESNPDYVLCYHDTEIIDSAGRLVSRSKLKRRGGDLMAAELVTGKLVPTNTVFFRNVFSRPPDNFYNVVNGDTFYFAMLGQHGKGKFLGNIKPSVYRLHEGGVWGMTKLNWKLEQRIITFENLVTCLEPRYTNLVEAKLFKMRMDDATKEINSSRKIRKALNAYKRFKFNVRFKTFVVINLSFLASFFRNNLRKALESTADKI